MPLPFQTGFFGKSLRAFEIIFTVIEDIDRRQLAFGDPVHDILKHLVFGFADNFDCRKNQRWPGGKVSRDAADMGHQIIRRKHRVDEPVDALRQHRPAAGEQHFHGDMMRMRRQFDRCRISEGSRLDLGQGETGMIAAIDHVAGKREFKAAARSRRG